MLGRPSSVLGLRHQAWGLPLWSVLGAASIAVAVWVGRQPDRLIDLMAVQQWLDYWVSSGHSVFPVEALRVDYPPHALVLLWPLRWLPVDSGPLIFMAVNVAASVGMAWLFATWMARETSVPQPTHAALVWAFMILSWGAVRVGIWNGQTVAIAIVAGLAALRWVGSGPWISGCALAVAACKPTLGLGFGFILLFRGHPTAVVVGLGVTLLLTAVFDLSVGSAPLTSLIDYAASLDRMYVGNSAVRGVTSIRKYFVDLSGGHPLAHTAFAAYRVITLLALCVAAWRVRRRPEAQPIIAAACLLWTLVALPNQRYYLVLLAPAVWLLTWTPHLIARPGARWPAMTAAGWVIFNLFDGPLTLRLLAEFLGEHTTLNWEWLWWASYAVAGPAILALYVLLLRALWRLDGTALEVNVLGPQ